ncbi:MAG: metallophosphoesterase family protein [Gammaproteobacteria bacterium]
MITSVRERVRLAAVGDIHYTPASQGTLQSLYAYIAENADIVLLCGDIIDYGLPEEALPFSQEFTSAVRLPTLAVLGNHEYESGKQDDVRQIFSDAGIIVLDGDACEVHGIGFAGVKGFAGGFGQHALQPWGEEIVKHFVRESVNETLKLESALAKLRTAQRVALLHYSPIAETVADEPPEILAFLGSSRLEEPLNRYAVSAVFHGHAHRGRPQGRTQANIPVYNVALPLLQNEYPDRPPVRLYELPIAVTAVEIGEEPDLGEVKVIPPDPILETPIRERS